MSYFGLDKWSYLLKIIRQHGGFFKSWMKVYLMDSLKDGKLMGKDKYGNTYYENTRYFWLRDRWVEYSPVKHGLDYDGSMISAEWFGWMHHRTDYLPHKDPYRKKYKWVLDHVENKTGTPDAYYPYSTVRPKIQGWIPPKDEETPEK